MISNNSTTQLITTVASAKLSLQKGDYAEVIKLLEPYVKVLSPDILILLAIAYMETKSPANAKELALPLWNTIFNNAHKQKNYDDAVVALTSLITCYQYKIETYNHQQADVKARDKLTEVALDLTVKHEKEFKITDARGKEIVSHALWKQRRYTLFLYAGRFNMASANSMDSSSLSEPYFIKAKELFDRALAENPNDLKCLLYKTRLIAAHQNPSAALVFLTDYEKEHSKSPSYHECMRLLCLATEDDARAAQHKTEYTRYCAMGVKDDLSFIFSDFLTDENTYGDTPQERCRLATQKFYKGKDEEAKAIISEVLIQNPDFQRGLEISLLLEEKNGDPDDNGFILRERILELYPNSIIALKSKAKAILKDAHKMEVRTEEYLLREMNDAYILYMQAYDLKCRDEDILSFLSAPSINFANVPTKIDYALAYVEVEQSAHTYFNLASAYFRGNQYENALQALKKTRLLDHEYENDWVSLGIIHCLLMQASSEHDNIACVKKLKKYISLQSSKDFNPIVDSMVRLLQQRGIDTSTLAHTDTSEQKEEKTIVTNNNDSWEVEEGMKDIIKNLMLKQSPTTYEKPKQKRDCFTLLAYLNQHKVKPVNFKKPGKPVFGYIDPKATFNSDTERTEFNRALQSGAVLSESSQGKAGTKKFSDDNWVLKIRHSGRRMPSGPTLEIPPCADYPQGGTLVPFKKVKSHSTAYNDVHKSKCRK